MLKFNESTGAFLLFTKEIERAEAAGLTLSTSIRGPAGEKVYFTADHSQGPEFNPYAVLEFFDQADGTARDQLAGLHTDYVSSWKQETNYVPPYPTHLDKEPMPFQCAGVEYALGRQHCIIGDEMGLGKTVQAVLLANALDARRVLVVCPASIRLNWRREIFEWSTLRRASVQPILKGSDGVNPNVNFTVVSYDLLRNKGIHAALRAVNFDLAIFDEGHYMKSPEAQRTRAVFGGGAAPQDPTEYSFYKNGLNLNCERMVTLTGTFLPNRPREAYTVARGFDWESIDYLSHDAFLYRYNPSMAITKIDPMTGEDKIVNIEDKGRLAELNARLRCNLMVRRLKKDVLPQLPDKRYEMTYVEPTGAIRDVLVREALIDFDPRDLFNPDFTLDGTPISTLRREMGEAMVPRVVEYVKDMLDVVEVPKLILYAHHTSVIHALAEALHKYGVVIHKGGMTTRAKEEAKADFIAGLPRIFLGQLDTMEGVDGLQSVCRTVVFAEPAWNPGRNEQCVDRAHRIGQHDNVIAHFLLVEGSFNEKVLHIVLDKAGNIHESLDRRLV